MTFQRMFALVAVMALTLILLVGSAGAITQVGQAALMQTPVKTQEAGLQNIKVALIPVKPMVSDNISSRGI